jgi:hypothetical protein
LVGYGEHERNWFSERLNALVVVGFYDSFELTVMHHMKKFFDKGPFLEGVSVGKTS